MGSCTGICKRYKAPKPPNHMGRYAAGQVRCNTCDVYMYWDGGITCPCCGYRLRTKPRTGKFKVKFYEAIAGGVARVNCQANNPCQKAAPAPGCPPAR